MKIKVIVVCINSEDDPEFFWCNVQVTEDEYNLGLHYDRAQEQAEAAGYKVLVSFDQHEHAAKQVPDLFMFL